jgi:uncharacterized protein (TIGR03067 family)
MKGLCTALLGLGMLAGVTALAAAEGEREKLQGTWRRTAGKRDGKTVPDKPVTLVIAGKKYVVKEGDEVINEGTVRVGTKSNPRAIDLRSSAEDGSVIRGLFRFKEGKLETCFARANAARPTAFASRAGSGHALLSWEREQPAEATARTAPAKEGDAGKKGGGASATDASALDEVARRYQALPNSPAPQIVVIEEVKGPDLLLRICVPIAKEVAEEFEIKVGDEIQKATRTKRVYVTECKMVTGNVKDLRVLTEEGKLARIGADEQPAGLKKGEAILMSGSAEVDPSYLQVYKPGTLIFVPQRGPAVPASE